jgi:hypothetical protein
LIFGAPNINALVKRSTLVHYNGPWADKLSSLGSWGIY